MSGVFLNYRSKNGDWAAEALVSKLVRRFGTERVFLDNKAIEGGQNFDKVLNDRLDSCTVLLALIGPDWLQASSPSTNLTIKHENDWVRWELDRTLPKDGVVVIPVYLDDAPRLIAKQLPPSIADLADLHGMPLRRNDVETDIGRIIERIARSVTLPECPYPGLAAFDNAHSEFFFGRRLEQAELRKLVEQNPIVAVVGAAGVGKSSLVHAGLAAASVPLKLVPDVPPDVLVRSAKRDAEARLTDGTHVVIVVDQFEEMVADDPDQATALFEAVGELTEQNPAIRAVFTMRGADLDKITSPGLARVANHAQLLLQPLSDDVLVDVIKEPARMAGGFEFESGLVERIIADAGASRSASRQHLIAFALRRLWEEGNPGELTHEAYQTIGGVLGALSQHAQEVYDYETDDDKDVFQRLLITLVKPGDEDTHIGSPKLYEKLSAPLQEMARKLNSADRGRLVVIRQNNDNKPEVVALVHAGLADHWGLLKDWLVRNRKFNSWLAATEENHKNRASLRGVTLSEAKTYYSERPDDIDTDVQTYIRSHLRRRRWFRITVAMVVVLAITASAVTIFSAVTAFRLRDLDIARGVVGAAQNLRSGNPALAAQLSLAAYRLGPDDSVTGNLLDTFASPYAVRLTQHTDIVETVAVHRGLLATGGWDSRVRLWDIGDPHRPGLLDTVEVPNGGAWSVAFSPDGQTLAVASADRTIHLVDISDPRHVRTRLQLVGHTDQVTTLAYGPAGGSRLLLATSGADRTVRLWDLHAPDRALAELTDHQDHVRSVAISPDGRTLASAGLDGTVRRWDITDPTAPARLPLLRHSGSVYSVSFSPKGPLMATAGVDGIRLWDITDPSAAVALSTVGQLTEPVSATVFDAAGTTLASANWDDKAYLWDITDPKNIKEQYRYTGHEDNVTSVAFASTGRTLITGDIDKTVRLWDLPPPALKVHGDVYSTDLDRTGRLLATGSGDWKARLWDVRSPYRPLATLDGHTHNVDAVVFAPRGAVLLTASFDGTAILWDIKNPRHPRRLSTLAGGHTDGIVTAAFTPDGATVATGSRDGTVRLWDVRDPVHPEKLERVGGNGGYVTMLTISGGPNGAFVAAVLTLDGAVRLWNITDPNAPVAWESLPSHDKDAWALAVSRDGRLLATASFDRTVRLWDISDPQRPRRLGTYVHNTHQFLTVAFSPDGRTLATGDLGRFVDLLDISNTGQLTIGTELDDGHT